MEAHRRCTGAFPPEHDTRSIATECPNAVATRNLSKTPMHERDNCLRQLLWLLWGSLRLSRHVKKRSHTQLAGLDVDLLLLNPLQGHQLILDTKQPGAIAPGLSRQIIRTQEAKDPDSIIDGD